MWAAKVASPLAGHFDFNLASEKLLDLNAICRLDARSSNLTTKAVINSRTGGEQQVSPEPRTCRTCKQMFSPSENHRRACRYHTAHFGGETKRKFESVHTGGTLTTVGGGEIVQYWHCCGVKDPFDAGCEAAPHMSYDD